MTLGRSSHRPAKHNRVSQVEGSGCVTGDVSLIQTQTIGSATSYSHVSPSHTAKALTRPKISNYHSHRRDDL